ncbi:MAG: sigma-54-dependent Fis family transcriptional regulator [Cyclobacteriaceae bacterium]|nr:sigma-54-dependent Fis family transcriptional regulator [Cyclobacteriaceae bacterium]
MRTSAHILVVDDDPDIVQSARVVLRQHFEQVSTESNPQNLSFLINENHPDVVLLDMNFTADVTKGREGLFWLQKIVEEHPSLSVVMVTAFGDVKLAVEAMKIGAVDFVVKPWENERLVATVNAAFQLSKSKREVAKLKLHQTRMAEVYAQPDSSIIGESKGIRNVFSMIKRVAITDANILLLGENGTGKELVAKSIHYQSHRCDGPFVKVDVGAIPDSLFESEMFGHVKGAFTDAKQDRIGRLELASGGTLFLDEIGNLPLAQQSKLLTVLQNRIITPVGSNKQIPIDIRLISATNEHIRELVAQEEFREDLLYRINTVEIIVPPLRERLDDIPLLLNHFCSIYNKRYSKSLGIDPRLIQILESYAWPGNIREFQHAVERAVILCEGKNITAMDFQFPDQRRVDFSNLTNLSDVERKAIEDTIHKNKGNLSKAAKELGLGRTTLYRKIEKYGL